MKKIRTIYDIISIVFVLVWAGAILFSKFASFDFLAGSIFGIYTILAIISYLYAFAIIGLAIYTYPKVNEHGALATTIIGCLILPFIVPILLYLFAIRKATKRI